MYRDPDPRKRHRIAVDARYSRGRQARPRSREGVLAICIISAAIVATFVALFMTSRPYDPMDSTIDPQSEVPSSVVIPQSSPKPSPSATIAASSPEPLSSGEATSPSAPDDTTIQAGIEKRLAGDSQLSGLDISTVVESGKVTIIGSVKSQELKSRVGAAIRAIKGVVAVDNQLVVVDTAPGTLN